MFKVEAGAVVFHTGNSIEKVHGAPCVKLRDWGKAMREFERVQGEMKEYYENVMKETKRGRRDG